MSNLVLDRPLTKGDKLELIDSWMDDFVRFCYEVYGDLFTVPFSPIHLAIIKQMVNKEIRKKLILAPRGIGKTTLGRTFASSKILNREINFLVYISNSLEVAEMQTENMKRDMLQNKMVRSVYGNIKDLIDVPDFNEMDESFSKKSWVAFGNTFVLPRGMGQQVRGLNWKGYRPDFILIDDAENRKELNNETIRREIREWILGDVIPAMAQLKECGLLYLDTLKHEDALPVHLKEYSDWNYLRLELCDPVTLESRAPDFKSTEEIKETYLNYKMDGMLDVFYREFLNIPTAPETASFSRSDFLYFDEGLLRPEVIARMESVVLVDLANTATPKSDDTAIVGVGIDCLEGRIYVRDMVVDKLFPNEIHDQILKMMQRLRTKVIAYEDNTLSMHFGWNFKNWLSKVGAYDIEVIGLKPKGLKKELRISSGLIPLYKRKMVLHARGKCERLEEQLLSFPNSRYDDAMDALAYLAQLMEKGSRFFMPVSAGMASIENLEDSQLIDIDKSLDDIESEYAMLDNEDPISCEELEAWPMY